MPADDSKISEAIKKIAAEQSERLSPLEAAHVRNRSAVWRKSNNVMFTAGWLRFGQAVLASGHAALAHLQRCLALFPRAQEPKLRRAELPT